MFLTNVWLWGVLIIFVLTLQVLCLQYVYFFSSQARQRKEPYFPSRIQQDDVPVVQQARSREVEDRASIAVPQLVIAFELPFQRVGVHTEEYRQKIEEAVNALYHLDTNPQVLSACLHQLLEAAKQNWVGLAAFSPREQEVLELLLQDITYKEMSSRLHVSPSTIKTHIYHVFQKLEVSNRDEAIRLIQKRGWFPGKRIPDIVPVHIQTAH